MSAATPPRPASGAVRFEPPEETEPTDDVADVDLVLSSVMAGDGTSSVTSLVYHEDEAIASIYVASTNLVVRLSLDLLPQTTFDCRSSPMHCLCSVPGMGVLGGSDGGAVVLFADGAESGLGRVIPYVSSATVIAPTATTAMCVMQASDSEFGWNIALGYDTGVVRIMQGDLDTIIHDVFSDSAGTSKCRGVSSIAHSPAYGFVAAGCQDFAVYIIDAATGSCLHRILEHNAPVVTLHSHVDSSTGAHAGFISLDGDGFIILSAFQEDSEQLQEGPAADAGVASDSKPPSPAVAGIPEVVGHGPQSPAAAGAAANAAAVKGTWSHAALLDMPVMKCERKSSKQNPHVVFQQVLLQDDPIAQAALLAETTSKNPKWNEKKVKDYVDQRVRSELESYLTLQASLEDKKLASKSRTNVDNDVETRRIYASRFPMTSPVSHASLFMPIPGQRYMAVVFRQWECAPNSSSDQLTYRLCLWPTFPEGDGGKDKGQIIPIDAAFVSDEPGSIGRSIAEITYRVAHGKQDLLHAPLEGNDHPWLQNPSVGSITAMTCFANGGMTYLASGDEHGTLTLWRVL